jgi:GT2 family glycosyltransferase
VNLLDRLGRLRRAARDRDGYRAFVEHVEPGLGARPRVHRFAAPPVLADPGVSGEPVAVCIETSLAGDPALTRASLQRQSTAPADVIEAPLADALGRTRAPWLVVLPAGDRLAEHAVERLGQAARLAADARLITFDDDALDRFGRRVAPRLRPGPSPDLLRDCDLTGGALCLRPDRVGPGHDLDPGAGRHALALALAGDAGAGHAHVPLVLRHRASPGRADGCGGADRSALAAGWMRRPLRAEPDVEVIVCFRDRPELLRRCVLSLLDVTSYERLRLTLIDNASRDPTTPAALSELAADPRVSVVADDRPFNFSALNNAAALGSEADVLVFLNNDTEVVEPGWVEDLLAPALRPEVGAVAPLLVHADGTVQHVGAAIGVHGFAGHPFAGLPPQRRTPFGSALDGTRNWLGVTAACLMIERSKFAGAGGFDERFTVAGNDVDLGLRLTARGQRSLCVSHVRLVHDGSASRDPARPPARDQAVSKERYGDFLRIGDPFYHPALTLEATDCALRGPSEAPA